MTPIVTYLILTLSARFVTMYLTQFIGQGNEFSYLFFSLRVFTGLLAVFFLLKFLQAALKGGLSQKIKSSLLGIVSILLIVAIADVGFMFVARSFGTGYPLADQNWQRKYWNPINSHGYRSPEINVEDYRDKTNILVVGSSYTAGDGIDYLEQRFTEQLESKLNEVNVVHNLGMCGSEINDEYRRLNEYPVEPDILVLTHTVKSIKSLLEADASAPSYRLDQELSTPLRFIVQNSYLANYIFWKFYAPERLMMRYLAGMQNHPISLYFNRAKLREHLRNLQKFVNYAEARSIPLVVISFPSMAEHMELTNKAVCKPVERYLSEQGIPVVKVAELVRELSVKQRTVNSSDAHPSPEVHSLIADELFSILEGKGLN